MKPTLEAAETELLADAGFQPPFQGERLPRGRNNQVLKVTDADGRPAVLKRYFQHPDDPRDRLRHEWAFLSYAAPLASGMVPNPLGCNATQRAVVLGFVEGVPVEGFITPEAVGSAGKFIAGINQADALSAAEVLPVASEACFTATDHADLIRRRRERLRAIALTTDVHAAAVSFVESDVAPACAVVAERLELVGTRSGRRVISPSDFGFHNAIRLPNGSHCFVDFEYAGWDGIGKLVADFFSQPRIRVDEGCLDRFLAPLGQILDPEEMAALEHDIPLLLAAHACKWCCIMLNEFQPVDGRRRRFAAGEPVLEDSDRLNDQFRRAREYFAAVCRPRVEAIG